VFGLYMNVVRSSTESQVTEHSICIGTMFFQPPNL